MWRLPIQPDEMPLSRSYHQREQNGTDEPGYIMVVDDSPEIGAALTKLLELQGHTVELIPERPGGVVCDRRSAA